MIRGIVYSLIAIAVFIAASTAWFSRLPEENAGVFIGWTVMISFFIVGPLFFTIGFLHNMHRNPGKPHWDSETGE